MSDRLKLLNDLDEIIKRKERNARDARDTKEAREAKRKSNNPKPNPNQKPESANDEPQTPGKNRS